MSSLLLLRPPFHCLLSLFGHVLWQITHKAPSANLCLSHREFSVPSAPLPLLIHKLSDGPRSARPELPNVSLALTREGARVEQEGIRHERETSTGQAEAEKSSGILKESDGHAPSKEVDADDMTSADDGKGGEGDSLEDGRLRELSILAGIVPLQNIIEFLGEQY